MKRKNGVRILAILLSILFVIPCVSLSTTAAEAERTYANASVAFYLTYDKTAGKPVVKNLSTFSAVVINSDLSLVPYTTGGWQNSTLGGDENGFLTIKPENTTNEFIVDLKLADNSWCATDDNAVKYFTMYYKVVGESKTEGQVLSVAAQNRYGNTVNSAMAVVTAPAKDGEWNYVCCSSRSFNTDGGGQFRLQFQPLTNPDSYIVIDYIAYVASEADALALKKNHDDYLKSLDNPISAVYQTRKEAGLARNNVIYFDGYSAGSMAAGYLNNVRTVTTSLNREITSGITVERPSNLYDDYEITATADGHIQLTTKTVVNDCAVKITAPDGTYFEHHNPSGDFKYLAVRYKLENGKKDVGAEERGYWAQGNNQEGASTIQYPAGEGWQMAIGQLSANYNDCEKFFILYLPTSMRALGATMVIDYIGFFDTEEDAREEYKIQSLADGVDVGFAGVQSWRQGDEASVRFVGKLDVVGEDFEKLYTSVGFDLTANGKPNKTPIAANAAYTSIVADGETVTAESLGTSYLFTYVVNGIDATVDADIVFTVTSYAYYNGRKISGPTYRFCYNPSTDTFNAVSD